MKKWNWKTLLPPPMLVALLFASCNLIQEMPQDFVETYGNIAYVESVDYVGLAEEGGDKPKVTETKNFKIIYSIRNDGNFDLSPEFTFEGCQIKNPHVDTEKKRVSLTVPGEELKALADGAEFKVKLTLYKASQKVLQSAYELGMRYVYTGGPETPKGTVRIPIPGLPEGYTFAFKDETADFNIEPSGDGFIITTTEGGVSEGKHELELVVKDEEGKVVKDEEGKDITIKIEVEVSAGSTTSGFTEKDDEKSLDKFIEEVEKKIEENKSETPPEESKNPTTEPDTPPKTGKVEITVKVPDGYTLEEIAGGEKDKFEVVDNNDGSWSIKSTGDGLPEGEYELELVVKDKETGEEVTIKKEIEVSAGKTTGGFIGEPDDKPSEITQDEIEKEKKNVVYVRGENGCYASKYPDAKDGDDDSNSGALLEPFATIQKAIETIINMNDGTSSYTIYIDGTLTQSEAPNDGKNGMADLSALEESLILTIKSLSETAKATLDANQKSRVMYAKLNNGKIINLTLRNLIIMNGIAGSEFGGGVRASGGTLKMESCKISGNEASSGGGVHISNGADVTINECIISGNTVSNYGGGIFVTDSTLKLEKCTIGEIDDKNTAQNGGGIYVSGSSSTFEITGGEIGDNTAGNGGGIYILSSKQASISGTTISGNTANTDGGGVYVTGCELTMDGTISGNTAQQGGGVYVRGNNGVFTMTGGEISGNHTTVETASDENKISGGGIFIYNNGKANISSTTISNNTSNNNGGGIHVNGGTLKINAGTIISKNIAQQSGAGVYVNGTFEMKGGTISENEAKGDNGGGVHLNNGTFTMSGDTSTISKNKAAYGGGVQIGNGTFIMDGGIVTENEAIGKLKDGGTEGGGGGVHIYKGTFTMNDGTISKNKCAGNTDGSGGGGVFIFENNTFTMTGGKIIGNEAKKDGGGVYVTGGTFTMSDGKIGDENAAQNGGGIYVKTGTFSMSGGEVNSNKAINGGATHYGQGGGVYVNSATFEISGTAKITNNKAVVSGGGIYNQDGDFTMTGGEISENTATNDGGGIYYQSGSFLMTGGTFTGNKNKNTTGKGKGAFIKDTFKMSDYAKFDTNNDVYLADANKIYIAGALNQNPAATITPYKYEPGRQVLQAADETTIKNNYSKFRVTQDGSTKWKIVQGTDVNKTYGVLKKDNVDVGGSGGISVTIPNLGKDYKFVIDGISDEGNGKKKLYSNGVITLKEVTDSSGKVLTASDGTFTIEIRDESGITLASATGFQCTATVPQVPPIGMKMQIYAKVVLKSGIVIDKTISVTGP